MHDDSSRSNKISLVIFGVCGCQIRARFPRHFSMSLLVSFWEIRIRIDDTESEVGDFFSLIRNGKHIVADENILFLALLRWN